MIGMMLNNKKTLHKLFTTKKKYTIVFDEEKISLAIKIGIFYDIDYSKYDSYSTNQKIHLFTLCYRPKYNDFVKISNINDLPKRLRNRYENVYNDDKTITELENIGIHNFKKIESVIKEYHNYQDLLAYEKYKNSLSENNDELYNKLLEVKNVIEDKKLIKTRHNR